MDPSGRHLFRRRARSDRIIERLEYDRVSRILERDMVLKY